MVFQHCVCCLCSFSEESSVEGSWLMRNDTLQTPGALQTPQLTSTVLRDNRPAEHMPDPDSEPGSENDFVHKSVHTLTSITFLPACFNLNSVSVNIHLHVELEEFNCFCKRKQFYKRGVCSPRVHPQSSDADVVARPAEDGGGEQEGPDGHELHQVTEQSGRPADCVSPQFTCGRFW